MGKVSTVTAEQRIEPVTCVFYFAVGSLPDNLAALGIVKFLLLLLMCIMFVISLFLFSSFFSLPFFSLFSLPSFSSLLGAFFSEVGDRTYVRIFYVSYNNVCTQKYAKDTTADYGN